MGASTLKPVRWMGSSKRDLRKMPEPVRDGIGFALYMAQNGLKHPEAKVLKGFGSAGVLEALESDRGGSYRAVYAVSYGDAVYVLHCFQKKSTQGISTTHQDLSLIRRRLAEAEQLVKGGKR